MRVEQHLPSNQLGVNLGRPLLAEWILASFRLSLKCVARDCVALLGGADGDTGEQLFDVGGGIFQGLHIDEALIASLRCTRQIISSAVCLLHRRNIGRRG